VLADGQHIELPTYTAYLEWFGKNYRTQVISNDGAIGLLGTALLYGRELSISYLTGNITLD
jgi:hypothetical protein